VSNKYRCYSVILVFVLSFSPSFAKPPSDLPGDEITEEQYFDFVVPRDSIEKKVPVSSPHSPTWLDLAAKTWDAPPISVQMAEDKENVRLGMGAFFVPYMSNPNLEPDVDIIDPTGKVIASGKAGRKYSFMPGTYHVMLGSGPHKQKIVRTVQVIENETTLVIPSWCGLSIEVVDKDNQPFRGEYEMARIDKFIPYGRGFGRNPDLGEGVKTWILKAGIYKIFGVGESYNTLTNFVTIRLLPGEFVRFVLVQKDETTMEIIGGGMLQMQPGSEIASNWKWGISVGGGINFNATYDHTADSTEKNETGLSLLFRSQLAFKKDKIDWENRLWISEEVRLTDWDFSGLRSSADKIQLRSIFTWHFLPWLGPYGRFEVNTELFPEYERAPEDIDEHYFIIFNEDYENPVFNSTDSSYKLEPPFSPLSLEPGIGANMTMPGTRYVEAKLLTGVGLKYNKVWDLSEIIFDTTQIDMNSLDQSDLDELNQINTNNISHTYIRKFYNEDAVEVGPEVTLYLLFNLGRVATIESEIKYFAPFDRLERPDLALRTTVSWRLIRMLTLDYEFQYSLKQPYEESLRENESHHRILIRFSYFRR